MASRSVVIEMIRSVPRRLPGGETEMLTGGKRYILDADEGEGFCTGDDPAAQVVDEYDNTPQATAEPEPADEE